MKPQVVHESEAHREHVRLEVPIRVEIDGARYRVDDWSIGGFGVENVAAPYRPGERFRVRVVFPFEGFELAVRADAEMIYADVDRLRFGCRFAALTGEQQRLFHYVVDSYLSGKLAAADDLLRVHGGPTVPEAAPDVIPEPEPGDVPAWVAPRRRGRAGAGGAEHRARPAAAGARAGNRRRYALAALAGLLLAGLVAFGVHERLLGVAAVNAVVDAPVYRLRAPIAGLFTSATEPGEVVTRGQAIGLVRGPDGAVAPVESPCPCIVLDQPGIQSQFYQPGEPLVVLIGDDQPPRVRAQVGLDDAEHLAVGDRARIRLPGDGETLGGRIEQIDVRPERVGLRPTETVAPATPGLVQVWIRPDRPLELDDLGTLASVRFPALPGIGADLLP